MYDLSVSSARRLRRSTCSLPIRATSTVTLRRSVLKPPPRWRFLSFTLHPATAGPIIPQSVRPRISCSRFPCFASDLPRPYLVIAPVPLRVGTLGGHFYETE